MKRMISALGIFGVLILALPVRALAVQQLIPVGRVIGLQLQDGTLTVAAFDDALGQPAQDAGLKVGDELLRISGTPVTNAEDVRRILGNSTDVTLTVRRGSRVSDLQLKPVRTENGPRLGVYLRQGIAGIGTVTFYDPESGLFGALGHGVSDPRGALLHMHQGQAYAAQVLSVRQGQAGSPGQLKGSTLAQIPFASLTKNTPQGVFGTASGVWAGTPLPVAVFSEVRSGSAQILATVSGETPREYSVEILRIYPESRSDGRNFLLRVTSPELLEATGGIVQGMSGSPIIQNGKLVGAVTHVLVNDPTMGYGIYIGNMLDAAA